MRGTERRLVMGLGCRHLLQLRDGAMVGLDQHQAPSTARWVVQQLAGPGSVEQGWQAPQEMDLLSLMLGRRGAAMGAALQQRWQQEQEGRAWQEALAAGLCGTASVGCELGRENPCRWQPQYSTLSALAAAEAFCSCARDGEGSLFARTLQGVQKGPARARAPCASRPLGGMVLAGAAVTAWCRACPKPLGRTVAASAQHQGPAPWPTRQRGVWELPARAPASSTTSACAHAAKVAHE